MSFAIRFSRAAMLGTSIAALSTAAAAQYQAQATRGFMDAYIDSAGSGLGSIHLPTANGEGLMVGVLVDDKDGSKYTLEAQLTAWIPGLLGPSTRVAFGGLYGQMREHSGQGMIQDAQADFAGRVEGTWRLEQNLTGTYMAYVYERNSSGIEAVTGIIEGSFEVHEADAPVPAPQQPDYVVHQRTKGVSDRMPTRPVLGDAQSNRVGKKRASAEGGKSRPSDLASARRGLSTPTPRLSDVGSSGPEKKGGVLAGLDHVQPQDYSDARSDPGQGPIFGDARRKQRSNDFGDVRRSLAAPSRPDFGDAQSTHEAAGTEPGDARRKQRSQDRERASAGSDPVALGRDALSDAGIGLSAKKRPIFGDAESAAPMRIPRGLSDAASSGPAVTAAPVKDAWQSAGSDALGSAQRDLGTPGSEREKIVWPVLMGAFRAKYKLID